MYTKDIEIIKSTGVTPEMLLNRSVEEITTPNGKYSVENWQLYKYYDNGRVVTVATVQVTEPINNEYPYIEYEISDKNRLLSMRTF